MYVHPLLQQVAFTQQHTYSSILEKPMYEIVGKSPQQQSEDCQQSVQS
jgi:hypothetical protein